MRESIDLSVESYVSAAEFYSVFYIVILLFSDKIVQRNGSAVLCFDFDRNQ